MYRAFYGLRENPFKLTPDPRYFFLSAQAQGVLQQLRYGLEQRLGFMMVWGPVGVGKTCLLRRFLSELDDSVERAYLLNPAFSRREDVLGFLLMDLGVEAFPEGGKPVLLAKLHDYLLRRHEEGKAVLLVVDDAQAAPDLVLEELRLLSNFETDQEKLVQILLVGQPELRQRLARPELRQLRQRIALAVQLSPLDRRDTAHYLAHRLLAAGGSPGLFSDRAVRLVHRFSRGVPRLINLVAERALIAGYVRNARRIGGAEVRLGVRDLEALR